MHEASTCASRFLNLRIIGVAGISIVLILEEKECVLRTICNG